MRYREPHELRSFSAELGIIQEASGSCRLSCGATSVLSKVYGPAGAKYSRLENVEEATVDVDIKFAAESSLSSNSLDVIQKEKTTMNYVKNALTKVIQLYKFPKQVISFVVIVFNDDGSVKSTVLNACVLALLDSGIPINSTNISVDLATLRYFSPDSSSNNNNLKSEKKSTVVVDPSREDEIGDLSTAVFTFSYMFNSQQANNSCQLSVSECFGKFSNKELTEALSIGQVAAIQLHKYFRTIMEQK